MIAGNLFARDYLLEGISHSEPWISLSGTSVAARRTAFLKLFGDLQSVSKPNEAQTEKIFIYPLLELLGWTDVEVQQTLSTKGQKQVPDALLFADKQSRDRSVSEIDQWKRYRHRLAVLEAKRWERALDRASKGDEGVPATQMLQYLSRVDVQTSGKLRFGILRFVRRTCSHDSCAFFTAHEAAGAFVAPAFPAPSLFEDAVGSQNSGERAAGTRTHVPAV